jgi:hypothetical protein
MPKAATEYASIRGLEADRRGRQGEAVYVQHLLSGIDTCKVDDELVNE